jgi:hypothetical protein
MANLKDMFLAAQSSELLARFTPAIWKAATDIVNEDPATQAHAARVAWAKRSLIEDGKSQAYAFVIMRLAFSENVTLRNAWSPQDNGAAITDTDIQSVVSTYVPKLIAAGV